MNLNTGDILLFNEYPSCGCMRCLDNCIKLCTDEPYSHSALVIVNPTWKTDKGEPIPPGIYVWESSYHGKKWPDVQTGQTAFGVQLQPLELYTKDYPGTVEVYVRRASPGAAKLFENMKALQDLNAETKHIFYDINPCDWIAALFRWRWFKRTTQRFYCSAFVSYILTQLGILPPNTDWTIVSPALLSSEKPNSIVRWEYEYGEDERITW